MDTGTDTAAGTDAVPDAEAAEHFATVLVVEVSVDGSRVRLVNRGHPAPLLLRQGRARWLEPGRRLLPLGLGLEPGAGPDGDGPAGAHGTPGRRPTAPRPHDELPFPAGSTLLLVTDGLTEARNADGDFYDPLARLARLGGAAPGELLDAVHRDVLRHAGGASADDMALLAVQRPALTARPRTARSGAARYGRRPKRPFSSG
ncbi:PP2C family protein-serine/threonine phosphatase [Streptomyces sp. HSW2009]|uniref:PP2C family protein-serine/threonine phosphatase n=1 Tax=Streptomyces sp. HSW2009 TaxID=3142890 RepID=UPI0032EBFAA3